MTKPTYEIPSQHNNTSETNTWRTKVGKFSVIAIAGLTAACGGSADAKDVQPTPTTDTTQVDVNPIEQPPVETATETGTEPTETTPVIMTQEQRFNPDTSSAEILEYYGGMESRWIEANGPESGVAYVENFLREKGVNDPVVTNADGLMQLSGLLAEHEDESGEIHQTFEIPNENLAIMLNTYLANQDELELDFGNEEIISRRVFNGMGEFLVRGVSETNDNPTLCKDQYDCLMAHDNADFSALISAVDNLPEGSSIAMVKLEPSAEGRYTPAIRLWVKGIEGADNTEVVYVPFENGFSLYPVSLDGLQASNTRALALNQLYKGAPAGEGLDALLLLQNNDQIQNKIGNANQQ